MIYDAEFKILVTGISVFVFQKNTESRLAEKCIHYACFGLPVKQAFLERLTSSFFTSSFPKWISAALKLALFFTAGSPKFSISMEM